jgi:glycerophosphoryl diester phosphodiesterase
MRPVVIAHRGASGHLPEHTLQSKALAYAMGADYLEQDIVATRDDELVVLHDIHLDGVTDVAQRFPGRARADGRYYVRDFTLAEIETLTVHERTDRKGQQVFPSRLAHRGNQFRVHTLRRELELVADLRDSGGHEVGIYPEIKSPAWHVEEGVDLTILVLNVLEQNGFRRHADPVYLQCFDEAEMRRIRHELGCELKLVQLIGEDDWTIEPTDFARMRTARGLEKLAKTGDGIGPWGNRLYTLRRRDGRVSDSGLARRAHDQGLVVHPYTYRSDALPRGFDDFRELLRFTIEDLAIDGLFTEFPDTAVRYLQLRRGATAARRS